MRLLADENIPSALVVFLRSRGHDVIAPEPSTPDEQVLALAAKERRILITQDKNLGNVLEYPPKKYPGIVLLRIHPPLIAVLSKALDALFDRFAPRDFAGRLFVLDRDGIRVRK